MSKSPIIVAGDAKPDMHALARNVERYVADMLSGPQRLTAYTVALLPSAVSYSKCMIYVSNESGGAVPAFSDGTNWRRVTDRAIVS